MTSTEGTDINKTSLKARRKKQTGNLLDKMKEARITGKALGEGEKMDSPKQDRRVESSLSKFEQSKEDRPSSYEPELQNLVASRNSEHYGESIRSSRAGTAERNNTRNQRRNELENDTASPVTGSRRDVPITRNGVRNEFQKRMEVKTRNDVRTRNETEKDSRTPATGEQSQFSYVKTNFSPVADRGQNQASRAENLRIKSSNRKPETKKTDPVRIDMSDDSEHFTKWKGLDNKGTKRKELPEIWQNDKSLAECNRHMLKHEIGCDVTFLVGNTKEAIHAHAYVLKSRSDKMESLLDAQTCEGFDNSSFLIPVPDISPGNFRDLLEYIYTDEIKLDTVQKAVEMITMSDKYGPKSLMGCCFRFLLAEMCSDNVCITLELAHVHYEDDVSARCLQFINVNAVDVLTVSNFCDLCRDCVEEIVKSDKLNSDEFTVYNTLIRWAQNKCAREDIQPTNDALREALGDLLYHVRFPIMDVQQFTERLSVKCILPTAEQISLYQYFHGDIHALDARFNENRRKKYAIKEEIVARVNGQKCIDLPNSSFETECNSKNGQIVPFYDNQHILFSLPLKSVIRYQGVSGPWLLKGVDAITFKCSKVVILRGIQVFGPYTGTDVYKVKIVVLDEYNNQIRSEEYALEANDASAKVYDVILQQPVRVPDMKLFTVGVRLADGIPTYHGTHGVRIVKTDDVDFEFQNSNRSFNGTDLRMGQIPGILYSMPS